jgi:hypothetical protein
MFQRQSEKDTVSCTNQLAETVTGLQIFVDSFSLPIILASVLYQLDDVRLALSLSVLMQHRYPVIVVFVIARRQAECDILTANLHLLLYDCGQFAFIFVRLLMRTEPGRMDRAAAQRRGPSGIETWRRRV